MNTTPLSSGRILIVDDEPVNLKLLEKMLGGQGYQNLTLVNDPREVLDQYHTTRPDLILLDINMPYLDGFQVMEQLKALDDPLLPPIIILTAQHGKDFMLRALSGGARDFITKPFDRNELLMRVRNLLDAQLAHHFLHDQNAALEKLVQERTQELHRTRLQVVQRLGMAAECRDEITGNHILRMSHYSALLAQAIGWNELECDLMLNASPMHDIGKIGIPDAILRKSGKLDPEELEIMKTHATIGGKLLEGDDSDLMRMAHEIALTHHEKWDGNGYPNGLAGESIPQSGRITALTDVFDALTSSRSYKKAWTVESAVSFIQDNSGKHFDPLLVDAFIRVLPDIIRIREHFADTSQPEA
jgi:putative two-component system response regulator